MSTSLPFPIPWLALPAPTTKGQPLVSGTVSRSCQKLIHPKNNKTAKNTFNVTKTVFFLTFQWLCQYTQMRLLGSHNHSIHIFPLHRQYFALQAHYLKNNQYLLSLWGLYLTKHNDNLSKIYRTLPIIAS